MMIGTEPTLSVTEFVAVFNQSLDMIYPEVIISGELANYRISKNRWVYFDLKDEFSSVKFFGTVSSLPGPIEEGMSLEVSGQPRLHNLYGFSVNFRSIKIAGEGSIAKAQALLAKKLEIEGLFSTERKRSIPYPPQRIGLITSIESAAYADFIKIINQRWGNVEIDVIDCLVQGIDSPSQIVNAIAELNQMSDPPDILVVIRGGGSADDLAGFSTEQVVRAVASSRVPTVVAIGHESDISLAELAADLRASTPSNAAELVVPSMVSEKQLLDNLKKQLTEILKKSSIAASDNLRISSELVQSIMSNKIEQQKALLAQKSALIKLLDPKFPIKRGYALIRDLNQKQIKSIAELSKSKEFSIELIDGKINARLK